MKQIVTKILILTTIFLMSHCSKDPKRSDIYFLTNPQNNASIKSGQIITPAINRKDGIIKYKLLLNDSTIFETANRDSLFNWNTATIDSGTFILALEVDYIGKNSSRDEISIDILPTKKHPNARVDHNFRIASTLTHVEFDSRPSTDPDHRNNPDLDSTLTVRYDFQNDGIWDTDFQPVGVTTRKFPESGSYTILAEVRDPTGLNDFDTLRLNVRSTRDFRPEMSFVQGGTFQMGIDPAQKNNPDYKVTLSPFYISRFEVTHRDYIDFLNSRNLTRDAMFRGHELIDVDDSDCHIRHKNDKFYFKQSEYADSDLTPVVEISWLGAVLYCTWLTEVFDLKPYYIIDKNGFTIDPEGDGYRLPTEAQWEWAAKGGTSGRNFTYAGSNSSDDVAWYILNSALTLREVGRKKPNELNIYDMSGNVAEWCWDNYLAGYPDTSLTDPVGPPLAKYKVIRGGSIGSGSSACRNIARHRAEPFSGIGYIGFRITRPATR